jgi:hypothetical protein
VRLLAALLAGSFLHTPCSFAQSLPGGEQIMAKVIDAEGGADAKRKLNTRVVKLTIDFGIQGMTGKATSRYARPANQRMKMEIQGMGTIEEGVTDGVAWSVAAMTGPHVKEGSEKGLALIEADFDGLLNWKKLFKKVECVAKETIDGKEYLKVEMTPMEGSLVTTYVDTTTFLRYRTDLKISTPMGEMDMVVYNEDYRPIDGVQYPHKSRVELMGQKRVVIIESIEHNVDIPKDHFEVPEEIKALVAKADGEKIKT